MKSTPNRPLQIGLWVVLFVSIVTCAPTLYPGYWQSLEGFVPAFNIVQLDAIADMAVVPDLWRGTGGAAYLLAQPFLQLGVSPVAAVRATFAFCFLLGGLGVYVWLWPKLGDRAAGLAGVLYLLWPPFLATVYVRGSLSDAWVLALLPLTLAGAGTYATSRSQVAGVATAIGVIWMWRTQAGLALFATLLLLAYALIAERDLSTGGVIGLSGAAGVASLIPLWSIAGPPPVPFAEHFVSLFQLFDPRWSVAPSIPGWQDGYPFQLGVVLLALGIVALWLWIAQPGADTASDAEESTIFGPGEVLRIDSPSANEGVRRLGWFGAGAGLLLVLLSLGVSAPLWRWSGAHRLLTYPWQITLLAGPLLAMWAGTVPAALPVLRRMPYWLALVALPLLSSYRYLTPDYTQMQPPRQPLAIIGANNNVLLLDSHMATIESDDSPAAVELTIAWQTLQPLDFDYNVFFQMLAPGEEQPTVVAQLDAQPLAGERPATTWQPGEILTDTYRLELPASATATLPDASAEDSSSTDASRGVTYYFGYYDWRDGTRVPVIDPLTGIADDKVVVDGATAGWRVDAQ